MLTPLAQTDHLMPMHMISIRQVRIDPTVPGPNQSGPDCYHSALFCKEGEVALGKNAWLKLLAAAGASPIESVRTDDRSNPHYVEWRVTVAVQDFDGVWRQMPATAEHDLREGSERAKGQTPKQLSNARRFILRQCETFAMEAAVRALFAMPHKMRADVLARQPFFVPKIVPILDPNDPDTKRALIDRALGHESRLFGVPQGGEETRTMHTAGRGRALEATVITPDGDPREQPQAVRETPDGDPPRDDEPADFDLLDFSEPKLEVCTCPCGCQGELKPEVAASTTELVGAPRCQACYPGKAFDVVKHRDVRGTLNLPKRPNLTAADVAKALDKQAAGSAKR